MAAGLDIGPGSGRVRGSEAYANLERALPGGGDERVTIAVLDGPVDLAHPCFAGARLTELQTLAAGSGGRALAHGTHVASVIFGQPGSAVRGIAPACRGLIAPIFSDAGSGLTCSQLDLARAILSAVEHGAHIINISGGQLTPSGEAEPILMQAVETCLGRNVLIVAAAGNDGCDCLHIPAAAPSVLAVGAMDQLGAPLASSNWARPISRRACWRRAWRLSARRPAAARFRRAARASPRLTSRASAPCSRRRNWRGAKRPTRTAYGQRSCATRNPARKARPWAAKSSWPAASISKQPSKTLEGDTT